MTTSRGLSPPGPGPAAEATLAALSRRLRLEVEVFEKQGRSRTFERAADRETVASAHEAGWAVRAGDARRSLFSAASGRPVEAIELPEPTAHPLLLPELSPGEPWSEPEGAVPPLATENEAAALFDGIAEGVARELAGSRLLSARLDDGLSESALVSTRGVRARVRSRGAWLRLEAERGGVRVDLAAAEREARRFRPSSIARRLADRLAALGAHGESEGLERELESPNELVLAAALGARLIEASAPLFLGRAAEARWAPFVGEARPLGSQLVTLVDDGRAADGLLAAASDGEGVPTRRVLLVEEGRFRTPLLAWWESAGDAAGISRRASWRDLPRRAASHFYLAPGEAAAAELVAGLEDGAFLIDAEGGVEIDAATLAFSVPVSGFRVLAGRAVAPLGPRRLRGTLPALFAAVSDTARDLSFVPGDGMFGAPTMRLGAGVDRGIELRPGSP